MRLTIAILAFLSAGAALAQEDITELIPGCAWKEQTVLIDGKANQKLSFRYQACDGANAPKISFELQPGNSLHLKYPDVDSHVAQFWPLNGKKPSSLILELAAAKADPGDRARCIVVLDSATRHYLYQPDAAFMEELLDIDEPYSACGELGDSNDSLQYFTVIGGKLLAWLELGQDTPLYDPESFSYSE